MRLAKDRCTGFEETTTDEGHKLWYSKEDARQEHEVGFLIHMNVVRAVIGFIPKSARLILIHSSVRYHNDIIAQVYSPRVKTPKGGD